MDHLDIGEFRLIAKLGRGGMADVYLAVRRGQFGFTKLVVVKRMRDDLIASPEGESVSLLLLDEARLGARLQHPNIVQTFEAGTEAGRPFLAMEYLDGQPLDRVLSTAIRTRSHFPVEMSLRVVNDVLSALEYAHNVADFDGSPLNVVHRDVSPHNIFVTYQGEVKLVDFGVAKHAFSSEHTQTGIVKGKLTYMAPEQAKLDRVDSRADIFSAGVVLWESVAMRRLLAADSPLEILKKLLHEPIPSLKTLRPDIDPAISEICDRALERDPERRYQTAAAMRADLESVIGAASISHAELSSYLGRLFEGERAARSQQIQRALASDSIINLGSQSTTLSGAVSLNNPSYVESRRPSVTGQTPISLTTQHSPAPSAGSIATLIAAMGILMGTVLWAKQLAPWTSASPASALASSAPDPSGGMQAEPVLRLCGSNTIGAELAPALVEAFLAEKGATQIIRHRGAHTDLSAVTGTLADKPLNIEIAASGSATAFSGLGAGTCDIGMASRAIEDAENERLKASGLGDLRASGAEHVIALDGIAVVVHPSNPLRSLDRGALHDIYSGKISDWAELGRSPAPISVLSRDGKSGTFDTFKHLVLGKDPLTTSAKLFGQNDVLADAVAGDPDAIGFVGLAYIRAAKALAVGEPGAQPMLPTQFTVATEGYMLARRLYLYTLPKPRTPWATEFVSYALSHRAQDVAARSGFVDMGVMTSAMECDASCPREYADTVANAERISVDFRFRPGSNEPDSRAARDLDRLVHYMRDHKHGKLLLLGFADADGNPQLNQRLSLERARSIETELVMRGMQVAVVKGLGSDMPVASNATEAGKQRNRRVEAWVEL